MEWTTRSWHILEWFDRAAAPQQERIGDELERRQIDVGLAGGERVRGSGDRCPAYSASAASTSCLPPARNLAPPMDSVTRAAVGVEIDVPALRAGLEEVEFGL